MLFKSDAQITAYLSEKSSSQLKPLLLMLNGDYAAEMPGSGLLLETGKDSVPRPGTTEGRIHACHVDQPLTRAAPGIEPLESRL